MLTWTNMAWPDDPYRTGQQLFRRPSPMLAAFAVLPPGPAPIHGSTAVAVVYLPFPRVGPLTVTEDTLMFGFRAAAIPGNADLPRLARVVDLDLMQACRHARYLASYAPVPVLEALLDAVPGLICRGLAAVASGWADRRSPARGMAALIDLSDGHRSLAATCRAAGLAQPAPPGRADGGFDLPEQASTELHAAAAAGIALTMALVCARGLDLYHWDGTLHTAQVMSAAVWDLFPHAEWEDAAAVRLADLREAGKR
jgi:hypothetical protein